MNSKFYVQCSFQTVGSAETQYSRQNKHDRRTYRKSGCKDVDVDIDCNNWLTAWIWNNQLKIKGQCELMSMSRNAFSYRLPSLSRSIIQSVLNIIQPYKNSRQVYVHVNTIEVQQFEDLTKCPNSLRENGLYNLI